MRLLKIILVLLLLNLLFLDNFKLSISGQLLDIDDQSSIIINDKFYFFGGNPRSLPGYTNQTIYLDLSKSFSLNQSLPIKLITPAPIPPFNRASLTLGGNNNDTLYLISGNRNGSTPGTTAYGCNGLFSFDNFSFVYETWRGSTNYFTKLKCHVKLIFIRNILLVSYLDV